MNAEFDRYSEGYDAAVNSSIAFSGLTVDLFTRAKVEYLLELIDSLRPPAVCADVIDIGCGVGNSHALLTSRVGRLAGVDVSSACVAKAAERNPGNEYKCYDGLNLPYPNGSFDVASAVCVFHHVPPALRPSLAGDVRRVLRPGGCFVIFEHNPLNPLTRQVVNNCVFDKDAILLRKVETEILLKEADFRDVETRFILALPPAGRLLKRIDRILARVPLGTQYLTFGHT